jgi:uncharacterized protein YbbC (DUF1343 family)
MDSTTGLPIISLYIIIKPTLGQLKGIDIMVFDLQDVGLGFTLTSSLHYIMEVPKIIFN